MKSYLNSVFGIWIVLFALFLPFTYGFFSHFGIDLTNGLSDITEWIAASIFGVEIFSSPTTSDSTAQFVQALLLLVFAILLSFLLKEQRRFTGNQIRQFFHTAAAYILSFFLLKYGVDKLFQFQFYAPEPNTLFTPLGMLSKDILFWSSMGTSSSYNTFMGLIEVIPAFLLLHHRTRLLGGLIALGVLVNVLMINFSFDITVKLLSMYLVIVSLFVLSPFLKNLFAFFIANTESTKPEMRLYLKPKVHPIIKTVVVILMFTEVLFRYVQMESFNGLEMEKIAHFGTYEVTGENRDVFEHLNISRIHIHSKGYLILEDDTGNFFDYPMQIIGADLISIRKESAPIIVNRNDQIIGFTFQKDGIVQEVICLEIDLDELPARDDSFHWTVDGMVGEEQ